MDYKLYAFADEAGKMMDLQIAAMKRNGLQGLEIRNVEGTNVSRISLEKAKQVRQKLDDNGLVTWSIGSPIGKISLDRWEEHAQRLKHTLEIAHILGAKNLRMFSFFMEQDDIPNHTQEVIDKLGVFLDIAKGSGVALCHENEKGIYGATGDSCLTLHKALPGMKGIFDPANFVQCGVDTMDAWEKLRAYTYYLHIKDALPDGNVVPSGKGIGNVATIVKSYLAAGGKHMTVEPHLTVFDGLKALEGNGDTSKIGAFTYASADEAFDVACNAIKRIVREVTK